MQYGGIVLDTKKLDALANSLNMNTEQAVKAIAYQLQAHVKVNIWAKKIIDTGNYFNSIETEKISERHWQVHDGVEYGIYQEFGTYKMADRPHWGPALDQTAKDIAGIIKQTLFKTGGTWIDKGVWEQAVYT